ncbi:MAG: glycosyltransferase family 39 protein [Tannerella sp.]|jgi:4-amino-4-deoxy-L-arabinose transferase-like glycosyltransferase|nr:glycosyltransferase family 39 protein [Tannerella sp.]
MRTSALQYLYLQKPISSVIIICAIALLPWINSDFYTKGEPREASVAVSMLESGNQILPKVYAEEFAYKPPLAHWLMSVISLPQGHVSEFTSRLPSALAQIILIGFMLAFFGKRIRFQEAFIATLLLITCFEIHRAGITARVDMLLTAFIVLGLMRLYKWENKLELKGLPLIIPLLFSCAILTKGPVGVILPLFVFFVYLLSLRKYSFFKIVKSLIYIGISSMFIPMLWYMAAYKQGGDEFLNVILAENFGRFFHLSESNINYDLGHKEGIFYNILTLLSGFFPWTLLFVFSLFGIRWRKPQKSIKQILKDTWTWFNSLEKMKRFSIVAAVCIIFFYTIPSSKRSVYLMPAYPFISLLLAQYFIYITENHSKVTRIFGIVLASIASIVFLASFLIMIKLVKIDNYISDDFLRGAIDILTAYPLSAKLIMIFFVISIITVIYQLSKRINIKILYSTILLTFCINFFIDGVIMKSVRQNQSAKPFAELITKEYNLNNENVYVMNNLREYLNLYALNFYMGNRFRNFETDKPERGFFLTTEKDLPKIMERYGSLYKFEQLKTSARLGDIKQKAILLKFNK